MNIHASRGSKVVFDHPESGYKDARERARRHLTVGATYTVAGTVPHDLYTDVYLKEVPGVYFNSSMFSDAS